jgi:hypothetical protein
MWALPWQGFLAPSRLVEAIFCDGDWILHHTAMHNNGHGIEEDSARYADGGQGDSIFPRAPSLAGPRVQPATPARIIGSRSSAVATGRSPVARSSTPEPGRSRASLADRRRRMSGPNNPYRISGSTVLAVHAALRVDTAERSRRVTMRASRYWRLLSRSSVRGSCRPPWHRAPAGRAPASTRPCSGRRYRSGSAVGLMIHHSSLSRLDHSIPGLWEAAS